MVVELFLDYMPQILISRNKLVEHGDGYAIARKKIEYTWLRTGIELLINYHVHMTISAMTPSLYLYTYK